MSKNPTKLIGYNLWVVCQTRQRTLNRLLKPYHITHAQYILMQYISRAEKKGKLEGLSQNKIAEKLSLDSMMVSNIFNLLEKKRGYILRKKAGHGMPITSISLTEKGKEVLGQAREIVEELEENLFGSENKKETRKMLKNLIQTD